MPCAMPCVSFGFPAKNVVSCLAWWPNWSLANFSQEVLAAALPYIGERSVEYSGDKRRQ